MKADLKADLKIAMRDSKAAARSYVIVNAMQAKHLPATPSLALEYFLQLGHKVARTCEGERVLVIGFAETATAIGAAVASVIENSVYVHTTREELPGATVADFFEEHSHAKNQSLYLKEEYKNLSEYDRLVFVEDEITTGKTIRNFLQSVEYSGKITVSALVFNGLDESVFSQYGAELVCMQKTGYVNYVTLDGLPDPRSGVNTGLYREKCLYLASQIVVAVGEADINDKDILVAGTEECMYPALILGCELEKSARSVESHSTTRSPLLSQNDGAKKNDGYPLHSRYSFASVYDRERTTYLYNLKKYDTVIVVTDAPAPYADEFVRTLQNQGNQTIYFVSLRNASLGNAASYAADDPD